MKYQNLSLLALACAACTPRQPPAISAPAPVLIKVVKVASETVTRPIRVSGLLAPKDEQKLAFKVGGVIDKINVEEGDSVRRGQVLAAVKLSEIDAQVAQAEQGFEKSRRDLARVKQLAEAKVATLEQQQDAETGFEMAKNQLQIARFNREYAVITAPASGRVLKRLASVGELAAPGTPILVLGSTEKGWVLRASVTDRERVQVKVGDLAQLHFDAFGEERMEARLSELASAPSPLTGTYVLELQLAQKDERFVTGLFGRGQLIPSQAQTLCFVPPTALLEADGQRGAVYVLSPDRQSLRRVALKLGPIQGERVAVLDGLTAGQEVVVAGAAYLSEGTAFAVLDDGVAQAP